MTSSDAVTRRLGWRKKLVLRLALFHFALVLVFDLLAIFAPEIMTMRLWSGLPFNTGIVLAVGIVFSVIASSFYYSYRINREELKFAAEQGETAK